MENLPTSPVGAAFNLWQRQRQSCCSSLICAVVFSCCVMEGNGGVIASSNLLKRKLLVVVWAAAAALIITKSANCSGKNVQHLFTWSNIDLLRESAAASPQYLLKCEHHLLSTWCCIFHHFFHRLHGWVFLMAPGESCQQPGLDRVMRYPSVSLTKQEVPHRDRWAATTNLFHSVMVSWFSQRREDGSC